MSIVLACSLLLATPAPAPVSDRTSAAQIEVEKGRCLMIRDGAAERTLRTGERATSAGDTHLEIGAGAEVALRWPGRASMHVWGPAAIEWSAIEGTEATEGQTFSAESLRWRLLDVAWIDLEVRRGAHELTLPGAWSTTLETGAFHLRGLPSGPVEFRHHAGSPVRLDWHGDDAKARPPLTIYAGSGLLLDQPVAASVDQSKNAQAWKRSDWDSERDAFQTRPEPQRTPEPQRSAPMAKVDEFTPETDVRGTLTAQPEPVQPEPVERKTVETPSEPGPATERMRAREEAPTSSSARAAYVSSDWRGVPLNDLQQAGSLAVQGSKYLDVRAFSSGRWKVLLDAKAKDSIWVFGDTTDYEVMPGGVAVFGPDGDLRMKFGKVESHEAPLGRPGYMSVRR